MEANQLFQENRLNIEIISALFSLTFNAVGLYLVYRWGRTMEKADDDTRRQLLGEWLSDLFATHSYIPIIISIYLGYKMLLYLIKAADWQRYLETARAQQIKMRRRTRYSLYKTQ